MRFSASGKIERKSGVLWPFCALTFLSIEEQFRAFPRAAIFITNLGDIGQPQRLVEDFCNHFGFAQHCLLGLGDAAL